MPDTFPTEDLYASRAAVMGRSRRNVVAGLCAVITTLGFARSVDAQSKGRGKAPAKSLQVPPEIIVGAGADGLPPAVDDMRSEILSAVETGDIIELRRAIDLNELKPDFGADPGTDPIEFLKSVSVDGAGKSVLDELGRLLEMKWAAVPGGSDIENNRMYVWPHAAELPFDKLTSEDMAALEAFGGQDGVRGMAVAGRYRGWRLAIGADGVWHSFRKMGGDAK